MDFKSFWESQRSTIISAIIAIVVIAGLFILFNALPAGQPAKQTKEEKQTQEEKKADQEKKQGKKDEDEDKVELPTKYTVVRGDHLWKISERFYRSGFNWTLIAQENKLANPDIIHTGNVFTIPKADAKITGRTHTVVKGDTLWGIAQSSYGSSFEWTKIRDANPGKIGTLPNGNALIVPGQVLVVP
ncbi:MAG: hypothetical protein A2Z11_01625 [Candidatus Woykebacteria bacterium RBG_16_43_9]|uniref:LysM domain-containing protein n=1 Tax=Candidatus Woykebacteria bacterium RBG_16_43_9 TaxID=1802596 RepID=A0A1G1WGK9_9BACT|nr:MAG: hypothetical protein A2Z11_01625 [Candidatus Woykebacteria bacterium RBG_16_43_9]